LIISMAAYASRVTQQNALFLSSEADRYFRRNATHNAAYDVHQDRLATMIAALPWDEAPASIADLGCSSGERLSALCGRYGIQGANGMGIDASEAAIEAARERDPDLFWCHADWTVRQEVEVGYDAVITSFAWHWIDRKALLDAMATAHRHVNPGGYLIINDFDSTADVPYAHREGVMTYKRSYPRMFLATGLYEIASFDRYDYPGTIGFTDPCSCVALRRVD
jgi:trans-aconitate methyltransferase